MGVGFIGWIETIPWKYGIWFGEEGYPGSMQNRIDKIVRVEYSNDAGAESVKKGYFQEKKGRNEDEACKKENYY